MLEEQRKRYSRHIALDEIGADGQEKLLSGKVLIIGTGGLGSPAALYLAAAGVGTIGIADADTVDVSNLQRQIIHSTRDVGRDKVLSAKEKMQAINPDVDVRTYTEFVNEENIADLVSAYDFVLDCTDNFKAKFLINDTCVRLGKPFSHAGVMGTRGQLMTYVPKKSPCYRCVFSDPPEDGVGKKYGVVGAAVGVIGSMQAMEAIKYLTGSGELLTGRLLVYDAMTAEFRCVKLPERVNGCTVCGERRENNEDFN